MRRTLSALLLGSIAVLPAMAHASPPDPIWIVGLYDDGDQDDLIALAAWATGATGALLDARPTFSPAEDLVPPQDPAPAADSSSPAHSRAPPDRQSIARF